jgi:hypothetical protein
LCNREIASRNLKKRFSHDNHNGYHTIEALVAILALAMVGLRWQTLFSGVAKGAQQVVSNPLINNATGERAKEYFGGLTKDAISVTGSEHR